MGGVAVTGPSRDMASCKPATATRLAVECTARESSQPEAVMATEARRLLEDVRKGLDCDLGTASKAAGCLATLLASELQRDSGFARARGGLAPWQKHKVRNYIEDRLGGSVRIRDLAKLVSLSAGHFSRAFKESFGESPHTYIVRMRIERAQTSMLTTFSSLSQIAFECGFADQAHLCKCFREATGTTPGGWRHSHAMGPRSRGEDGTETNEADHTRVNPAFNRAAEECLPNGEYSSHTSEASQRHHAVRPALVPPVSHRIGSP
jgi:AraC family transcriptional regulator